MNNIVLWIILACNALLIIVFTATPFLTRKTELFGVSLPSDEIGRPELSKMRGSYVRLSILAGAALMILTIVLFAAPADELEQLRGYIVLIFACCGVYFVIYLAFHRAMKAFKKTQPWRTHGARAETAAAPEETSGAVSGAVTGARASTEDGMNTAKPVLVVDTAPPGHDVMHPFWLLFYAAIGIFTALYLWYIWPSLPDMIPVHMDAAGMVDGWVGKSPGAFVNILFAQWILIAVFVLVYFIIPASKRQIDAANPEKSREQGRRFRYRMSACMVFGGAGLSAIMGFLPIAIAQGGAGIALFAITLVFIFVVIAMMLLVIFLTGQGGSRLKVDALETAEGASGENEQRRAKNTDDDRYWKLGQFYFNPDDPAIFVEKRFGVGWTNNFARPVSWLFIGGIAAVVIISLIFAFSI